MCRRFIKIPWEVLRQILFGIEEGLDTDRFEYTSASLAGDEVFPKATVPLIHAGSAPFEAGEMKWGYEFPWHKGVIYNTRAETATGAAGNIWHESLHRRRCIIPSFGFYEPHGFEQATSPKTGKPIRQEYFFTRPGSPLVFMAGIHEQGRFSVMTTQPNRWVTRIHNRMPVVLKGSELSTWLHGDYLSLLDRAGVELSASKAP